MCGRLNPAAGVTVRAPKAGWPQDWRPPAQISLRLMLSLTESRSGSAVSWSVGDVSIGTGSAEVGADCPAHRGYHTKSSPAAVTARIAPSPPGRRLSRPRRCVSCAGRRGCCLPPARLELHVASAALKSLSWLNTERSSAKKPYVVYCHAQITMSVRSVILYMNCDSVCSSVPVRGGKLLGNASPWEGTLNVRPAGLGTGTSDSSVMLQPRGASSPSRCAGGHARFDSAL